jgi:hypothetical protein
MRITKQQLQQIIQEEFTALTEIIDDQAAAKAEMQSRIRQHQEPAGMYDPESGSETVADYKYNMEKQYNDKEALQAIKEVLELVPDFKRRLEQGVSLSLVLRELAEVYAKNPNILDVEPEEETDTEPLELKSREELGDPWAFKRKLKMQKFNR